MLLVEDNPTDEKLALHAFKRAAVKGDIVVVRDGAEALDWLFGTGPHSARDADVLPAVVLLDLSLPRVSGHEVLRRVRADPRTRLLPVVILSASREAEDIHKSYQLGANAYLRKPVDFAEFGVLAQALDLFWLQLNQCAVAPRGAR
ncbi:MAG: response regulator [Archangiaceae bacterium]|nr:response regulator [Archangiaceae bacterium]